jgi:hypothetical protein
VLLRVIVVAVTFEEVGVLVGPERSGVVFEQFLALLSLFRRVVVLDICPHLLASVGRLLQLVRVGVRVGVVVALGAFVSAFTFAFAFAFAFSFPLYLSLSTDVDVGLSLER